MITRKGHACAPRLEGRSGRRSEKGSVLIEFAFVLPVFLLLLFGMVTFSLAMYNKTVLTQATREGARAGIIYDPGSSSIERAQNKTTESCLNLISFGSDMPIVPLPVINGDILTVTASLNYTGLYIFPAMQLSAQTSMRLESP